MKRDIYAELLKWKGSSNRKPLVLRGARQTGKTFILKAFGASEYAQVHYFNFEKQAELDSLFARDLNPERILRDLSRYQRKPIKPQSDLVIFDEIQASNNALNSLKYFQEEAGDIHVAAAGSLLGSRISSPRSFPVGKVDFLNLHPMTVPEFLDAVGESRYRKLLEEKTDLTPLPEIFHNDLLDLLRRFYFVGGMPEAVQLYCDGGDMDSVRQVQRNILDAYTLDFAKHAPAHDIPKLSQIWESIPSQLARENRKFVFSAVHPSARARDYEDAIIWLENAGLIQRAFCVEAPKHPLKGCADPRSFKVYALDVGLLGALAEVPAGILTQGDPLFSAYEGAFVESFVAQHLHSSLDLPLYYWRSSGKRAEVDFLFEMESGILPLEAKAGVNPKSKSLRSYDEQFSPPILIRTTLLNLKRDARILNVPLYALFRLRDFAARAISY
ncbi:MAG: AAA family ATPase [Candidatus Eisenbacteria bacterium]|uniref:AAA family ATPase n=1 Tax=Eiseniibacteriota bacterium TaxID=2212470 RepID=A0A948RT02_UNCEI|nr:AAA family ATPase [Candidatus Eisenbacteria bacterium]MBU1949382.1 AAA family ATPase [Candidatus Eisenbacteria bacterium]MBU2690455.1 AAA family ATPase [Candidatus Eisenbacteria bacterium]